MDDFFIDWEQAATQAGVMHSLEYDDEMMDGFRG